MSIMQMPLQTCVRFLSTGLNASASRSDAADCHLFKVLWAVLVGLVLRHRRLQPEVRAVVLQVLVRRQPILQRHACQQTSDTGSEFSARLAVTEPKVADSGW